MKSSSLRLVYSSLALVALVASSKAMVWPQWPSVRSLDGQRIQATLSGAGFSASSLQPLQSGRSSDLATSSVLGYRLADGLELRLMRAAVRHRFNMQTAVIGNAHKQLKLSDRFLSVAPVASAVGQNKGRWLRQTCFVAAPQGGGEYAVTKDDLTILVDRSYSSQSMKLKSLIGLVPNRDYQCVFVSLSSPKVPVSQDRWNAILEALKPSLAAS